MAMLEAAPLQRRKMAKEVGILDDEIHSRYDKIHGADGLCFTLVELFNAMAEIRLKAEYGDYLAYTCCALKGEDMKEMIWKVEQLDWQAVADKIKAEEEKRDSDRYRRRLPLSPTPYLDDVAKAASRLGYDESLVRYQIMAYAERNNFCHSGVKALAENGDFQALAEKILEDKKALDVIFQGRPHEQIQMRSIIKIVEREWFYRIWDDGTGRQREVRFNLTEKAEKKLRDRKLKGSIK